VKSYGVGIRYTRRPPLTHIQTQNREERDCVRERGEERRGQDYRGGGRERERTIQFQPHCSHVEQIDHDFLHGEGLGAGDQALPPVRWNSKG
jgi:hypothetical protein